MKQMHKLPPTVGLGDGRELWVAPEMELALVWWGFLLEQVQQPSGNATVPMHTQIKVKRRMCEHSQRNLGVCFLSYLLLC